jgi:CyaY protein
MDELTFDKIARAELQHIEEQLLDVDPDDVEVSSSDGVLTLELRDGVRVVVNSHRAARQIWMAAVASAWKFSCDPDSGRWLDQADPPAELRATLSDVIRQRINVSVEL